MAPIKVLPPHVVKQIAAGECIERPASVVKELVENSMDAGATRIEVFVEDAGNRMIRVQDNGCGIPKDELPLALASHATSKVSSTEDLMRISTLGFRGEALASISSVAEVTIASCCGERGYMIEARGEQISPTRPLGMAQGTRVEVRNLFFTVPARRKFLKSKNVEMGHISDTLIRLALSKCETAFQLTHNGRLVFSMPAAPDPMVRIRELLASKNLEFFPTSAQREEIEIKAYLGKPGHFKSSTKWQYFYLNNRSVKDKVLMRALSEAYRDYLPDNRHPVAVCYLYIEPSSVDVNVHPAKIEVRFRDAQKIYRMLYHTVLSALQRQEMALEIPLLSQNIAPETQESAIEEGLPLSSSGETETTALSEFALACETLPTYPKRDEVFPKVPPPEWTELRKKKRSPAIKPPHESSQSPAPGQKPSEEGRAVSQEEPYRTPRKQELKEPPPECLREERQPPFPWAKTVALAPLHCFSGADVPPKIRCLQVHDCFLVLEIPEGIAIIDQHALHERIIYDRLRRLLKSEKVVSQPLLFPETLHLSPEEMATYCQWQSHLQKIGIEARQTTADCIIVTQLPQILGKISAADLVSDVLEQLEKSEEIQVEETMITAIATIACKTAVKAGEALPLEEILSLLKAADSADNPFHCPHGRPTMLKITLKELEKYFYRR